MVTDLREPLMKGDTIEVPSIGALSVIASGATPTAAAAPTTSVLSLVADREPWINVEVGNVAETQLMDGYWAPQVAGDAIKRLRNNMDEHFLGEYLARTIAYDTSATYHDNVAGDSLQQTDLVTSIARLLSVDGVVMQDLELFVSSFGQASIMNIAGFIPNFSAAENGSLGIPRLGYVNGVPVYMTNSITRSLAVATTAVSVATNVATATVGAGHGLVPGMTILSSGHTVNTPSAVAITSVGTNSVSYPLTTGDTAGMADGTGLLTSQSSMNVLLNKAQVFTAIQKAIGVRLVAHDDSTGTAMQISTIWGRVARAGHVRVLHSPANAA